MTATEKPALVMPTLFDQGVLLSDEDVSMFGNSRKSDRERQPGAEDQIRIVQHQFNELHEEIYKKGGIKPTNAAIDEVGKIIFLKLHYERFPDYTLKSGAGQGKLFTTIFVPAYVRSLGKVAVRELQDAFEEISTLQEYAALSLDGDAQTIFPYKEALRLDNPDVLALAIKTLHSISLTQSIDELLHDAQNGRIMHLDLLGCAYDIFLRGRYDNSGGLGTYLTPSQVVNCMVDMAFSRVTDGQLWAKRGDDAERNRWNPSPQERDLPAFLVGDICCGTGRFLVAAMEKVRSRIYSDSSKSKEEKLNWYLLMIQHSFFGADQAASSIVKARINMIMFGELHPHIINVEDPITDVRIDQLAGRFDLILTNPPFGDGKYETLLGLEKMRRQETGLELGWQWKRGSSTKKPLQRADPALLFLDRNLQLLKQGGQLLAVLPDGILEPSYSYSHEYLLKKARLSAVVSLPKSTFAITGTVAKTSFICLEKSSQASRSRHVAFMAAAQHTGYIKKGKVEVPDPSGNDLLQISKEYWKFTAAIPEAYTVLQQHPMIVAVPDSLIFESLTADSYHPDSVNAQHLVPTTDGKLWHLEDVCDLAAARVVGHSRKTSYFISVLHVDLKSNIDWEAAASHTPSSKGLRCQPNDVIFSCLNPTKVRVSVIPSDVLGEVLCSSEFAVLRAKPGEDPYFVALALRARSSMRQIIPLSRGTSSSRRRIKEHDLMSVVLPYPSSATRRTLGTNFRVALENARAAFLLNSETLSGLEELAIQY